MARKKSDTCFVVTYKDPAEDKVLSLKAHLVVLPTTARNEPKKD